MRILVDVYESHCGDRVLDAMCDVRVEHSPKEGYDNKILGELEKELRKTINGFLGKALGREERAK